MCFHPWEVLWVLEGDGKLGAKEGNVLSSAPQGGRGPPECGRFPGTRAHCLGPQGNIRTHPQGQGPSSAITGQLLQPPGTGHPAHRDEAHPPLRAAHANTRKHQPPSTDVGAGTLTTGKG